MNREMPVGVDDFKEAREQYYIVDKTDFIRKLIDEHSAVMLFTRPRRFGKTLTMSMVDHFFSIDKAEKNKKLFSGLAIDHAGAQYMKHQGKYPVIFITLKDCAEHTWEEAYEQFQVLIKKEFKKHAYLLESPLLSTDEKESVQRFMTGKASDTEYKWCLGDLSDYLYRYFQVKPIILIDEYDAPLQAAYEHQFYDQAIAFFRRCLSIALKGNENLNFAILTGVQRIAKESIFSGLNNLDVYSILDTQYDDVFGFTPIEVQRVLQDVGHETSFDEIKEWYDGYRFGNAEIYNPWSVIAYVKRNYQPKPYWIHTAENSILQGLLLHASDMRVQELQGLLHNQPVSATLNDSIIYDQLWQDDNVLYTMLLTTGYLTIQRVVPEIANRYALCIPNEEIRQIYSTEILNTLVQGLSKGSFDTILEALVRGQGAAFEQQLQRILQCFVSSYDAANKESFYHGFMLGMTALFITKDYVIESNRESGYGRFDLAIFPTNPVRAGVIMEFKVAESVDQLDARATEALQQIEEKKYITEFQKRQITNVWKYGIAFSGKHVKIVQSV